jgi:hypothetical protein
MAHLWFTFANLIAVPFQNIELVWGIVPLYFGWIVNEVTSSKASFRTALQTGFVFTWAAAQWLFPYVSHWKGKPPPVSLNALLAINIFVSLLVLVLGLLALVCGARRKFPKYCTFLGHTRFSAYFTIAMFPIQAHYLHWTWERLAVILVFAVPVWIVVHLGLMPLRK